MDSSTFDTITRAFAQSGTRRRLLALLAALPFGGLLTDLAWDEVAAERPTDRVHRRTKQRNQNQRKSNNKKNNNNNGKNNVKGKNKKNKNKGVARPRACTPDGSACQQSSQCCSGNCFNFVCAAMVSQCSAAGPVISCTPPDSGGTGCCAGEFDCCFAPENQCDQAGFCCAPNCTGKQCGPDGCGNTGTCGSCAAGQTCTADGQCQGPPPCSPQTCTGCCDGAGVCQSGTANTACGTGGGRCTICLAGRCVSGHCQCDATYCAEEGIPDGCCIEGPGNPGLCLGGTTNEKCGTGGELCRACPSGTFCCNHACQSALKPNGAACTQDSECCVGNCFNGVCADRVTACGTEFCSPSAKGCAGNACCFAEAFGCAGNGTCCDHPCCGSVPELQTCCGTCQICSDQGTCQPAANGTPCTDGNPLCVNGRCCTDGHEVVHGGCFQITQITNDECTGCSAACQTCGGSIDGSPNFLCANETTTACQSNTGCPVGQACQTQINTCLVPC